MVSGWRLAFCTTFTKDTSTTTTPTSKPIPNDETDYTKNTHPTSRFSFFSSSSSTTSSTTSTPRINNLRCRTASATAPVSLSNSPKLTCKTTSSSSSSSSSANNSPRLTTRLFNRSSPSSFSLIKSTLRLSKPTCGVCLHSVKTGQGTAIFTAECSHQFHFPCVVDLVTKRTPLPIFCPVCTATWKELPLFETHKSEIDKFASKLKEEEVLKPVKTIKPPDLKIYNDDEPLTSPTAGSRFNPIPESDYENDDIESVVDEDSFQGFFTSAAVSTSSSSPVSGCNSIDVTLLEDSAFISAGRGYETVAVLMEVKAPDVQTRGIGKTSSFRAPVDFVAVIDVTNKSNLQTTKRAMRVLISSLSSNDRLSIVAFSSCSKRLLPLRRMTVDGRRSARRIIDVIVTTEQSMSMSAGDAVRKAAKVLEDRRVKNPVNSIIVLSNVSDSTSNKPSTNINRQIVSFQATRSYHLNIPIHTFAISDLSGACAQDEAFAKSIGRLLSVPVQDLRVQFGSVHNSVEMRAVYLCAGRTKWLGSGTGLIKLGDFHADEKREILIELKVSSRAHLAISVRSSYTDPSSQQLVTCKDKILPVPIPNPDPKCLPMSTCQKIERLRCLFIMARAVAESKRLAERNDFSVANQLLTSALALVSQSNSTSACEYVSVVEAELVELKLRRQQAKMQWEKSIGSRMSEEVVLTPISAWRTAERLAKVARMRKSLNRVSDLHGFENARF